MLRTYVVSKSTTPKALSALLASDADSGEGEGPTARLAALQRLNPHIADLARIPAGTVVLIADAANARGATRSVAGPGFEAFAEQLRQAAAASSQRVNTSYGALAEAQKEVAGILKSAAIRKQVDADADLQRQVKEAELVLKADQQNTKAAQQTLAALQADIGQELAVLAKLFD